MKAKIENFKENIKNKKVAVIGIGVSNTPLIKYLYNNGALVFAFDKKEREHLGSIYDELSNYVEQFCLGEDYLSGLNGFDYIFRTPGMRYDIAQLFEASKAGTIITSEMELFMELCPATTIGITGSDGKTTTTTLVYNMLKEEGYKCWVGGNIGTPLLDKVEEMNENDKVILELSSFQLHTFKKSPNISIMTNLSPNHLDYHTSYEEYIEAKTNIFNFQTADDILVLNFDNDITKSLQDRAKGNVVYFSRVNQIDNGIVCKDGVIYKAQNSTDQKIIETSDILLPGVHNIENYMAAIAAVDGMVSYENIKKVATTFPGVEHRIELVRELNGIKFYNDSIGTSPTRTTASLNSFNQKVILIAGGYDKKLPFDQFGHVINEKVKELFLVGHTSDKIEDAVRNVNKDFKINKYSKFEDAVIGAFKSANNGDVVILSPACASFDLFPNFAERGRAFKDIVNSFK